MKKLYIEPTLDKLECADFLMQLASVPKYTEDDTFDDENDVGAKGTDAWFSQDE